jgi:signal transduction histidine kinase
LGFLWILFSGNLVYGISADSEVIVTLERYKGWFFILITGVLLFLLIKRESVISKIILCSNLTESKERSDGYKSKILQSQNERLEEFAFITSHNLRKPLANISGTYTVI